MGDPCQLKITERERGKKVVLSFGTPSSVKVMREESATDYWIYEVSVPEQQRLKEKGVCHSDGKS